MRFTSGFSDYRLIDVLMSPVERLVTAPPWAWCVGMCATAFQVLSKDIFSGAIILVFIVGIVDYLFGFKAAKLRGDYQPSLAHAGAMGKISGLILLLVLRLIEGWLWLTNIIDTGGIVATAVAVSLIAVDIQSIAHHRESFGAKPIPVLSQALAWIQNIFTSRIPKQP